MRTPLFDWQSVDWRETNSAIARRLGCSPSAVAKHRPADEKTFACVVCGQAYEKTNVALTCSPECSAKLNEIRSRKRLHCKHCGGNLIGKRQRQLYCSDDCRAAASGRDPRMIGTRNAARRKKGEDELPLAAIALVNRETPQGRYINACCDCGAEFRASRPDVRRCAACKKRHQYSYRLARLERDRIHKNCVECGAELTTGSNRIRFCSDACAKIARNRSDRETREKTRENLTCRYCGKTFTGVKITQVYCSQVCREKYHAERPRKN